MIFQIIVDLFVYLKKIKPKFQEFKFNLGLIKINIKSI
ncbi:hypothetical protein Q361_11165 [Flavobacterium croceum DSM 17960]|uniref:Uncharacterized protein n=1 Tax=Flavobacterium croceum DSM 17960 TaxID=1121886 RepID=A0A2S4N6L0_9FLAO|nr:hypothetical protein Q361_11165 [Flavobacterium croceum DSM 17960]